MADIRRVTEQFAVAPQLELDDFADIAAQGFTHIINNRPDGESPDQPSSTEAEAAAKAVGLSYAYAPFVGQPTAEAVKAAMAAKGKTLAYCRSGTRSVTAWALAQASGGGNADEIVQAAANAGYNLAPMAGLLKQAGDQVVAGIPFVRDLKFKYGEAARVSPRIRRVIAENPGPFTYLGTGVYIVGNGEVAVIDPGPVIDAHFEALKRALDKETVTHVFTTHTHLDHSPLAHPLAEWAGCKVYGRPDPGVAHAEISTEEGDEAGFRPDTLVIDGDLFSGKDWTLEAITTPGHMSNHVCFALKEENALFSGDHIMGWSTTVISPPDGSMRQYFSSLEKIKARGFTTLWPTHGPPVLDVAPFIDAYTAHRRAREAAIVERMRAGDTLIPEMVKVIYKDVDKRLHAPAAHSVLAHVIQLVEEGRVLADGPLAISTHYRLAP